MTLVSILAKKTGESIVLDGGVPVLLSTGEQVDQALVDQALEELEGWEDDQLAMEVRRQRDDLIEGMRWRLERYERQFPLGETDDSDTWYNEALQYVQNLRDVPQQEGFPENIEWPEEI
jgi:hypothetical protein